MASLNERFRLAAESGSIREMESLRAQGVDIDAFDNNYTHLVWAVVKGRMDSVRWLLQQGAKVDRTENGWTPLMSAVSASSPELVQLLLDHCASPLATNSDGKSAIHLAREKGNESIVRLLTMTPDEIIFNDRVHDRVVQEVYSFKRNERFTFVRKSEFGDIEAVQRESFADITDKSALRRAFDEHRKRGGKREEAEVFSDSLQKPRRLPTPGASAA